MIIENDEEHRLALQGLDFVMEFARTEDQGRVIEVLSLAIDVYERAHYPIADPTPAEAAAFRAEQEAGTLCCCDGGVDCVRIIGGERPGGPSVLCRILVCEERGHVPIEKMTAVICDRCGIVLRER